MNKNIYELIEYPKEGILSKNIHKDNKSDVTLFCMTKDAEMLEHTSTREGFIYVLEGEGIFNLEGKDIKMKKGTLIIMNKNEKHSLGANKNLSFLLTLI
ncbi:MAG: cupin domain-containing protein [Candidatus Pacearchaeota archaeon]